MGMGECHPGSGLAGYACGVECLREQLAAAKAEVQRLQDERGQLEALLPPVTIASDAFQVGFSAGRKAERSAIVHWLREHAESDSGDDADCIERGEHSAGYTKHDDR